MSLNLPRLVFVVESPLTERDFHRFGIVTLREMGYHVDVLDFSPVVQPARFVNTPPYNSDEFEYFTFLNSQSISQYLESLDPSKCFLILFLRLQWETRRIFSVIDKRRLEYCFLRVGMQPPVGQSISNKTSRNLNTLAVAPHRALTIVARKIRNRFLSHVSYKEPKFVVLGGKPENENILEVHPSGPDTQMLPAHSFDYDFYIRQPKPHNESDDYIVFLDQMVGWHPDGEGLGRFQLMDFDSYNAKLLDTFDLLEDAYKMPVVVALHPRACLAQASKIFKGRRIEKGLTNSLIANASLVLAHHSNAILFSIIYKKPLLFLNSSQYKVKELIDSWAAILGAPVQSMDLKDLVSRKIPVVNSEKYREYMDAYVRHPDDPDEDLWLNVGKRISSAMKFDLNSID